MATRIWIEPGCIQCNWCSDLAPEVFTVTDDGSHIRGDARSDGKTNTNRRERAALAVALDDTRAEFLDFVAGGCPVSVIKIESDERAPLVPG